jgi:Schlafen, AlbA_2
VSLSVAFQDLVQAERRQSRSATIYQPLPWPSVEWKVPVRAENPQMLHGELVASDAPAFLSFDLAAAAFFGVAPSAGGRSFSGTECVIREQDRRGRIDSVRVRPTEVVIAVSGDQLGGTLLTLGGLHGRTKRLRRGMSTARFPLADGIPSGSWLALHRGSELLDRRGLDPAWGRSDVEIEVDPVTEVEVLISGGEAVSTELKRQLPPDDRVAIVRVMKTVAAFANGIGGTILFGVEDDGTIVGIDLDDARKTIDRITDLISGYVRPLVGFDAFVTKVGGKNVLLVRVKPGSEPPYGVATTERRIDYYVRRNGTSLLATPADVRAAVRAKLPASAQQAYFPR